MPIASYTPEAPTGIVPNVSKIAAPEYKGIVVDTKYVPLNSLITYVAGSGWRADYYSQVINKDNDIRSQDTGQSSIYQQYIEIRNFELKVSAPLTQTQTTEDRRTVVVGSSIVYASVIPNKGDMFCADVGDGQEGIFKVVNTDKKGFLAQAVYSIDYELVAYTTQDPTRKADLIAKSIKSMFFVKDFALHGQNPLLVAQDYQAVSQLEVIYYELAKNYFTWFYNRDKKVLLVPGQTNLTYDAFLSKAVLAIVDTADVEQVKHVKALSTNGDVYLNQPQFWNAMIELDLSVLSLGNTEMGLVTARAFNNHPSMEGISYSGIRYIVYPKSPDRSVMGSNSRIPFITLDNGIEIPVERQGFVALTPLESQTTIGTAVTQNIHPVNTDGKYVLSAAFYNDTDGKSVLEILTRNYLEKQDISPVLLFNLCAQYKKWGMLEKFYYIPILLILIKSIIRST